MVDIIIQNRLNKSENSSIEQKIVQMCKKIVLRSKTIVQMSTIKRPNEQ